MDAVREWAQSVVIAALVAAVVGTLSPSGSLEKPIKVITALFMLLAFVSPLAKIQTTLPKMTDGFDSFLQQRELEKQVEEQVMSTLENEIRSSLTAYIKSLGCDECEITADMDIDSSKDISIKSITVTVPKGFQHADKVSQYSLEKFGVSATIITA